MIDFYKLFLNFEFKVVNFVRFEFEILKLLKSGFLTSFRVLRIRMNSIDSIHPKML